MTTTIADTFTSPAGTGVGGVVVRATLVAASEVLTGGGAIIRETETTTAADGTWSLTLTPIDTLAVSGGAYYLITADGHRWSIDVPASGTHTLDDVQVEPDPLASLGLTTSTGVALSTIDAKGDLLVGAAPDTIARLAVGADGRVLTADSAATDGVSWQVVSAGAAENGIPTGGTTGQLLRKASATDFDAGWHTTTASDVGADAAGTAAGLIAALTPASIGAVPTSRTVAGHALTGDVTLAVADVSGAAPAASPTFTGTATMDDRTQTGRTLITYTALTDAATIAVDASLGDHFTVTLGGSRTLGNPSNVPGAGQTQMIMFAIRQDATGSRTLTLGTDYRLGADITAVTLSTGANKTDYLGVRYDVTDAKWDVVAFVKGY